MQLYLFKRIKKIVGHIIQNFNYFINIIYNIKK